MGQSTGIEWTDATWNPVMGCRRVSAGCEHCYAEAIAARFSGPGQAFEGLARRRSNGEPQWTGNSAVNERTLHDPLGWRRPRRVFVNSMSDLFYEQFDAETVAHIFAVMALAGRHTFQVLTKRPERMRELLNDPDFAVETIKQLRDLARSRRDVQAGEDAITWPLPNVWLGVSVENQATTARIPYLLDTPAVVRFLSCEPLLGSIAIAEYLRNPLWNDLPSWQSPTIDWVIAGGESGPHARAMHPEWARSLRDQCAVGDAAFFFKQWGEYAPATYNQHVITSSRVCLRVDGRQQWLPSIPGYAVLDRVGKKRAGRQLDGRTWDEFPTTAVGV